ncbi:MAG: hypothetical protein WAM08_08820, partial [Candidatus Acidiferrales bacterium]
GDWINGGVTGLGWSNVQTTPGFAFGTQPDTTADLYDDSTAIVAGTWGPTQTVEATVHTVNQSDALYEEVELRVHTSISANSITGYEITFRCTADGSQYVDIVRWNGPLADFSVLAGTMGPGLNDGDVVKATIVGTTITAYINGEEVLQTTDDTYATGSPGIGFYIDGGTVAQESDYGFTNFTAIPVAAAFGTVPKPAK